VTTTTVPLMMFCDASGHPIDPTQASLSHQAIHLCDASLQVPGSLSHSLQWGGLLSALPGLAMMMLLVVAVVVGLIKLRRRRRAFE
jgi:hypothetical protein